MRIKLSVFAVSAALAAGSAVLLASPSASAINCPQGTRYQVVTYVADRQVGTCLPWMHCDPAACPPPPTEAAPRD